MRGEKRPLPLSPEMPQVLLDTVGYMSFSIIELLQEGFVVTRKDKGLEIRTEMYEGSSRLEAYLNGSGERRLDIQATKEIDLWPGPKDKDTYRVSLTLKNYDEGSTQFPLRVSWTGVSRDDPGNLEPTSPIIALWKKSGRSERREIVRALEVGLDLARRARKFSENDEALRYSRELRRCVKI